MILLLVALFLVASALPDVLHRFKRQYAAAYPYGYGYGYYGRYGGYGGYRYYAYPYTYGYGAGYYGRYRAYPYYRGYYGYYGRGYGAYYGGYGRGYYGGHDDKKSEACVQHGGNMTLGKGCEQCCDGLKCVKEPTEKDWQLHCYEKSETCVKDGDKIPRGSRCGECCGGLACIKPKLGAFQCSTTACLASDRQLKRDSPGNDLYKDRVYLKQETECCQKCKLRSDCVGYVWNTQINVCWLKGKIGKLQTQPIAIIGVIEGKLPSA